MVSFPKIGLKKQSSGGSLPRKRSGLFRGRRSTNSADEKSPYRDSEGKEVPPTPITPLTTGSLSPEALKRIDSEGDLTPVQNVQVAKHRSDDVSKGDNSTVISELTNPREMQQQQQQQHTDSQLRTELQESQLRLQRLGQSQTPVSPVRTTNTIHNPQAATIETKEEPDEDGYIMRVLDMVERSCMGTLQVLTQSPANETTLDRKVSFAPEWGMPPTADDDDDSTYKSVSETTHKNYPNRLWGTTDVTKTPTVEETQIRSTPSDTSRHESAGADDGSTESQNPNRQSPGRDAVLFRNVRSAQEQKKKAENDKRYKDIIMSLKEQGNTNLPTVDEEKVQHGMVRIPGMDGTYQFVQTSDFVGKENLDDEATAISKYSANELLGAQHMPEEDSGLFGSGKGSSWLGMLGLKRNENTSTSSTENASTDKPGQNTGAKPQWKEVVDPRSGRVYYYHRITRETTWNRPPEDQLVKKNKNKPLTDPEREIREIIENKMPHTDDDAVLSKRDRIARMLTAMAPPNAITVEELVIEFAGREDDLIKQLRSVNESKPFDEPVQRPEKDDDQKELQSVPINEHTRSSTSVSARSRLSEMTPQIRNTRNPGSFDTIYESAGVGGVATTRVPSNIPVPRRRDLKVEEYSSDRIKAETFDTRRAGKLPRRLLNQDNFLKDEETYNDGTDQDTVSVDNSGIHDSVSALSESEYRADVYNARLRALDDAIASGDWDLAAALSEGMRSFQNKNIPQKKGRKKERQSELDLYISQNNWDGVANYIAQVRTKGKTSDKTPRYDTSGGKRYPSKHFGARSQLQHNQLNSVSSYESSDASYSASEGTSTDLSSYNALRYRKNEFAC